MECVFFNYFDIFIADDFKDVGVPTECTARNDFDSHEYMSCMIRNFFFAGVCEPCYFGRHDGKAAQFKNYVHAPFLSPLYGSLQPELLQKILMERFIESEDDGRARQK